MNKVPMTVVGEAALRGELERLKKIERPRITAAIAEAEAGCRVERRQPQRRDRIVPGLDHSPQHGVDAAVVEYGQRRARGQPVRVGLLIQHRRDDIGDGVPGEEPEEERVNGVGDIDAHLGR